MNLQFSGFDKLDEIASIGPATIQVWTKNGGVFRVHAAEYLQGGSVDKYHALYDELVKLKTDEAANEILVWSASNIALGSGGSIDDCLSSALGKINNLSLNRGPGPHKV